MAVLGAAAAAVQGIGCVREAVQGGGGNGPSLDLARVCGAAAGVRGLAGSWWVRGPACPPQGAAPI